MSKYVELPIDLIELDKSNPRIANYLATHDEKDITSELMALLLGTTSDSCASLRQSIEATKMLNSLPCHLGAFVSSEGSENFKCLHREQLMDSLEFDMDDLIIILIRLFNKEK